MLFLLVLFKKFLLGLSWRFGILFALSFFWNCGNHGTQLLSVIWFQEGWRELCSRVGTVTYYVKPPRRVPAFQMDMRSCLSYSTSDSLQMLTDGERSRKMTQQLSTITMWETWKSLRLPALDWPRSSYCSHLVRKWKIYSRRRSRVLSALLLAL